MTVSVVNTQPLIDAIDAAVVASGVAFGDGEVPTYTAGRPYVVAWFDSGTVGNRSMRSRDGFALVGTFHCIGLDPDSCRFAARKLRSALFGLHLSTVDGRTVQMPEHLTSLPMQRDDDADPTVWDQIDEWRIRTTA